MPATLYTFTWNNLEKGDYEFTIFDSFDDGICCGFGEGEYTLTVGGTVVAQHDVDNDPFTGSSQSTQFSIPEPATLALVALGLVGLGVARRRKRK